MDPRQTLKSRPGKGRSAISRLAAYAVGALFLAAHTAGAQHDPHWSYGGNDGPEKWSALSPAFASCSAGKQQSPIDIATTSPLSPDSIAFAYAPSALHIVNNGHTVQVSYEAGSSFIELGGARYDLLQFHFHSPSEHSIAGRREAMELHFVHRAADGGLAVVGVLLREGAMNSAYEPVLRNLPRSAGSPVAIPDVTLDAMRLLPRNRAYWSYAGSLTTPPCSEGVRWVVLKQAVELSRTQIDTFEATLHHNARPLQPVGTRTVGGAP